MQTINLESDELLTLSEACRLLPTKPSPTTLWRWRTKGILVNGQRIRLECIRVGGKGWHTTRFAFSEFLRRQTEVATVADSESTERSERTERKLTEAGLL